MSDPSDFVSGTIDDLLLSMAEGLVHAQEQLNRLQTVDALGRPGPTYQVPYLDFDLRVTAQFVTDPTLDQKYRASMLSPGGSRHLVMRAIQPSDTTIDGFKGEIVSNLRGRFVAVPPNAGKPPLVISTTVEQLDPQHHALRVLVRTALGEPLPGLQVHYNLDSALSIALSAADGVVITAFQPTTVLAQGVVLTDATGLAQTTLMTSAATPEPTGTSLVVAVDVAGKLEHLVVVTQ
jgi:hypothetical protein